MVDVACPASPDRSGQDSGAIVPVLLVIGLSSAS